jgi:hypothetical protein
MIDEFYSSLEIRLTLLRMKYTILDHILDRLEDIHSGLRIYLLQKDCNRDPYASCSVQTDW